jgi:hypothetical protein
MAIRSVKDLIVYFLGKAISIVFSKPLESIIRIEGGLGSQLIGLLKLESRRIKDPSVRADVSYFSQKSGKEVSNGSTIWSWQLDKYGYSLDDFSKRAKFYDKYLGVIFSLSAKEHNLEQFASLSWRAFAEKFPLADGLQSYLDENKISLKSDFAVIHVRRGDYLKVASKLVFLEESISVFKQFMRLVDGPVFISSDENLSEEDLAFCNTNLPSSRLIIVDPNIDIHIVHSLMRCANLLVTSNSTFSWTAGMLSKRESPVLISPLNFVREDDNSINGFFRSTSSWMIIDVD